MDVVFDLNTVQRYIKKSSNCKYQLKNKKQSELMIALQNFLKKIKTVNY